MDIKNIILVGGAVKFSYKESYEEWMGTSEIFGFSGGSGIKPKIILSIPTHKISGRKEFEYKDIDEAVALYKSITFHKDNLAYKKHEALMQMDINTELDDKDDWLEFEKIRLKLISNE